MLSTRRVSVKSEKSSNKVSPLLQPKSGGSFGTSTRRMAALQELDEELLKSNGDEIFSVCEGSHEHPASPNSEIGDYELNYLHNLYQQTDILTTCGSGNLTMLPETVVPPQLSLNASCVEGGHMTSSSINSGDHDASGHSTANEGRGSQPDTPPRQGEAPGHTWVMDSSSAQSSTREDDTVVSAPAASPVPPRPIKTSTRKRKLTAIAAEAGLAPVISGTRSQRAAAAASSHHHHDSKSSADKDSQSASDRVSERAERASERAAERAAAAAAASAAAAAASLQSSSSHVVEIFEVRPEDDPHGLFNRDPSTLTLEEQRLVKKQRRLLKNRESAQLSRHRKKMHLNALERQVEQLKKERAALSSKVQELYEENERLRKQVVSGI